MLTRSRRTNSSPHLISSSLVVPSTSVFLALVAISAHLVGCGSDATEEASSDVRGNDSFPGSGDTAAPPGGGPSDGRGQFLPCEIEKVLTERCGTCHGSTPAYGAPGSLVTYADLMAPAVSDKKKRVLDLVQARIRDEVRPMPPPPNARLSDAELLAVDTWIAQGALPSPQRCGSGGGGDPGTGDPKPLNCTPDTFMRPAAPAAIGKDEIDQYMCYGFELSPEQKRHAIALAPKIDNKALVHHLLLFQVDRPFSSTPAPCSAFGSAGWRLINGWAPGGQNIIFPPEAGYPIEGNTHWVLQVHYNNSARLENQTDSSGYDICTTDQLRPNDADIMALGGIFFEIPPHSRLDLNCEVSWIWSDKIKLIGTSPHMHLRGRGMSSWLVRGDSVQTIIDQPNFSFESQIDYPVNLDVNFGDVLRTRCSWENETANPIGFGEDTGDEMCFNFVGYYPKVTGGLFSWISPSLMANCRPE